MTIESWDEYYKCVEISNSLFESIPPKNSFEYHQTEADMMILNAERSFFIRKFNHTLEYANKGIVFYEKNDLLSLFSLLY
ncbi:MAG: hypothetical protein ACFFG0_07215 [Candidatus Thorarchaeota archaeon]